jgi:4-carboxymuconolactone decarboxylase
VNEHGRLPWYKPHELDAPRRQLYDRITGGPRAHGPQAFERVDEHGRLHGPFNALLVSPDVGSAVQELGAAIRFKSELTPRAREIAILEVAVLRTSAFEWYAHERVGKQAGLTVAELAALREGEPAPTFSPSEALVRATVQLLVRERDLDDDQYTAIGEALGERGLMDLIALVGYYELLALSLRVWRTPLPDGS